MSEVITIEDEAIRQIKEELNYDPETGILTWSNDVKHNRRGMRAGCIIGNGYRAVRVGGRSYLEHRAIWCLVYGTNPTGVIDHINGVRDDNKLSNLRDITMSQNQHNRVKTNNKTGYMGVYQHGDQFQAMITVDNVLKYLGLYDTKEEASAAYMKAKLELHVGYIADRDNFEAKHTIKPEIKQQTKMKKLEKLAKVNESLTINRYDNGWMVEIGGKSKKDDWVNTKTLCNTEADVIEIVKEYNSLPIDN